MKLNKDGTFEVQEVKTTITMEFGEGNYNTGPICKPCYNSYRQITVAQV